VLAVGACAGPLRRGNGYSSLPNLHSPHVPKYVRTGEWKPRRGKEEKEKGRPRPLIRGVTKRRLRPCSKREKRKAKGRRNVGHDCKERVCEKRSQFPASKGDADGVGGYVQNTERKKRRRKHEKKRTKIRRVAVGESVEAE